MAKKTTAQITTSSGQVTVEARETGVPGLVVTRAGWNRADVGATEPFWQPSDGWVVTHIESGWSVTAVPFTHVSDAVRCAQLLGETYNFDQPGSAISTLPGVRERIPAIRRWIEHERVGKDIKKIRRQLDITTGDTNGQTRPQ